MSENIFDRLTRKDRILQQRIDEERKKQKPLTEGAFERGEHLKSGQVIPPYHAPKTQRWFPEFFQGCIDAIDRETARYGSKS